MKYLTTSKLLALIINSFPKTYFNIIKTSKKKFSDYHGIDQIVSDFLKNMVIENFQNYITGNQHRVNYL